MDTHDTSKNLIDLRVGIVTFVAIGLVLTAIAFAGGEKGLLFAKSDVLKACLGDIGGLKKGATVTMGGMAIGKVTSIDFQEGEITSLIAVSMQIRSDFRPRIKADSIPSVKTQGMLGDRYIEISMGTKSSPPLPDGTPLIGKSASDFDETLREAKQTLNETNRMLSAINQQQGSVGQFFYDREFYEQLTEITQNMNEVLQDFKKNPRRYVKLSIF